MNITKEQEGFKMSKWIYILCPVTIATKEDDAELVAYVDMLEEEGHKVHLPARDTDQDADTFNICLQNSAAIQEADEVHIFYRSDSLGSHFDLGVTFALKYLLGNKKTVKVVEKTMKAEQSRYGNGWFDLLEKMEG
jgi:hypothetical protein